MANTRLSPEQARQILLSHMPQGVSLPGAAGQLPGTERDGWRVRVQTYAPGDTVLQADALSSGLSLIVQGQMAVYTGQRHESRPLVVLTPGRTFGRAAPALCPANATLKALTSCEVWFLEPGAAKEKTGLGEGEAEAVRRRAPWASLGLAIAILLAVAVLLAVPPTRAALATLPMGVGDWCNQQGETWCARQAWTTATRMAPQDATPALALGMLAFRLGDLDAAERAFEQARSADPGAPEAYNNLGVVYHQREEYERAAAVFAQALALEPGCAAAQRNLGDSLLAMQAYGEAIDHYLVALSLGGPRAETLANMAVALYQAGEPAEAEKRLQQALARAGDEGMRDLIGRSLAVLQAAAGTTDNP